MKAKEYLVRITPWDNGQGASVEFTDNTPFLLADEIKRVVKEFYRVDKL